MTRPDDAASVKMLREALLATIPFVHDGKVGANAVRMQTQAALAATAPPKKYTLDGPWLYGPDGDGDEIKAQGEALDRAVADLRTMAESKFADPYVATALRSIANAAAATARASRPSDASNGGADA